MFQLTEEQEEEIQVLESIYGDSFAKDKSDPSKYSIDLETTIGRVTLRIKLIQEYPMVLPEIDVTAVSHKLVTHDLIKALKTEAEGQVGMAMVFSLACFTEDWIAKKYKNTNKSVLLPSAANAEDEDNSRGPTLIVEKVFDEGTLVTRESFLAWRENFLKENVGNLKGPAALLGPVQKESKITGKLLFEQNKGLVASDAAFADDGVAFEIDESAFEGINLDEFNSEEVEEEEVAYDNRGQISDEEN